MPRRPRWFLAPIACLVACGGSSNDAATDGAPSDDSGTVTLPDGRVVDAGHDTITPGGDTTTGDVGGDTTTPPSDAPLPPGSARDLAVKLRGKGNFMIGMGNDLADDHDMDGAYTLGVTMDLHYAYMVGLPGSGGWPDWNSDASGPGAFVDVLADPAKKNGVTPMYTRHNVSMICAIGGTEDATATPEIGGVETPSSRLRTSTPYSSAVRPLSVCSLQ